MKLKIKEIYQYKNDYLEYCIKMGITSDWNIPQLNTTLNNFIEYLDAKKANKKMIIYYKLIYNKILVNICNFITYN